MRVCRRHTRALPPIIGCGGKTHDGGHKNCPAYKRACRRCGKIGHFSKVCRQGLTANSPKGHTQGAQNPPCAYTLSTSELPFIQVTSRSIKTAPTIAMEVSTPDGQATLQVLPDSGADICAAGPHLIHALGEHMDNLAESTVTPKAVNGSLLHPTGKIPNVMFELNGRRSSEDVHIYESVSGTIILWSVAQMLGILPDNFPNTTTPSIQVQSINLQESLPLSAEAIMSEFPSVFNGQIRTMPGEKFQISLTENAHPFCVTTPRTVPFAYRDKLKNEIDLLINQEIIAPVTEPTEWCVCACQSLLPQRRTQIEFVRA